MTKKINVLVIDDSPLIRSLLTEILNAAPDIRVIGTAEDPYDAREKIKRLQPDVLTLDIEMPKMDGISFLRNLMRLHPLPVIMISTLTEAGAPQTLQALSLGAVDFVAKPKQNVTEKLVEYAEDLYIKIRAAARARLTPLKSKTPPAKSSVSVANPNALTFKAGHIVAIGASTGGTEAIKEVVVRLPAHFCPIVIAQHIPPVFSTSFAKRLDTASAMTVHEAEDGMVLETGHVYIAPGDDHLIIKKLAVGRYQCVLTKTEPVNRHRPSVDVLFDSVALHAGRNVTAAILTGMGADGAKGLVNIKRAGAVTIAQDEQSSVVWGMPKAAIDIGGADKIAPLGDIADLLMRYASSKT
ncbi:protein-glutamate methylesterase/protein-glutamine glutaminase [Flocculibacter collagenilyticus]|uniref:protein-glutamate methylesterase/protein-glutamine glutaminase n=1 Tax=Flocculibacter collagenilyticus TaxID=2744479 RepID=UPI0018F2AFA2|nr:chemotaxis response regulator protein-glutamate methylesterase [Flocculibacter collagenilyticus]